MTQTQKRIIMSVAMAALVLVSLCAVGVSALSVSAAQGNSANVQAPGLVGAAVGAGAPGVCSVDGTSLDLFIRGADNQLYLKHSDDGVNWLTPAVKIGPPGTVLASAPAATSPGTLASPSTRIEVFVRGNTGHLYELTSDDSGAHWSSTWTDLGGILLANTGPSATSWISGMTVQTRIFVTGTTHWCYMTSAPSTGWTNLGGYLTSAPAATALPDGSEMGLFVAGTGGSLYYKHFATGVWDKSWTSLGGQVLTGTSPAAYNWGTTQIGWLVTGTNNVLYRNWRGSSSGYESVGGVLTSSPSATAKVPSVIDVFGRGSSGQFAALYQRSFNYGQTGVWGVWTALGGV